MQVRPQATELGQARLGDTQADATTTLQDSMGNSALSDALSGRTLDPLSRLSRGALALASAGVDSRELTPGTAPISVLRDAISGESEAQDMASRESDVLAIITRNLGRPLPRAVRERMEGALGGDFRAVRVHTDPQAGYAAQAVGSRAFAVGQDIFFAPGEFAPGSHAGDRLLAHELTHVVQAREGRIPTAAGPGIALSSPQDSTEIEAERGAESATRMLEPAGLVKPAPTETAAETSGPASPGVLARAPKKRPLDAKMFVDASLDVAVQGTTVAKYIQGKFDVKSGKVEISGKASLDTDNLEGTADMQVGIAQTLVSSDRTYIYRDDAGKEILRSQDAVKNERDARFKGYDPTKASTPAPFYDSPTSVLTSGGNGRVPVQSKTFDEPGFDVPGRKGLATLREIQGSDQFQTGLVVKAGNTTLKLAAKAWSIPWAATIAADRSVVLKDDKINVQNMDASALTVSDSDRIAVGVNDRTLVKFASVGAAMAMPISELLQARAINRAFAPADADDAQAKSEALAIVDQALESLTWDVSAKVSIAMNGKGSQMSADTLSADDVTLSVSVNGGNAVDLGEKQISDMQEWYFDLGGYVNKSSVGRGDRIVFTLKENDGEAAQGEPWAYPWMDGSFSVKSQGTYRVNLHLG